MHGDPHLFFSLRPQQRGAKKLVLAWVLILMGMCLPRSLYGQRAALAFERYATESGLSNYAIMDILQDQQGFIWIGTQEGLNRYDGRSFKVYRPVDSVATSLSDSFIYSLYEDSTGYLWIGTGSGVLNRFDLHTERFTHYAHDPQNPNSLTENAGIIALYMDRTGHLWIGTDDAGLNRFDPDTGLFSQYLYDPLQPNSLSSNRVYAIHESPQEPGVLWIGTADGLNKFDLATERFTHYKPTSAAPRRISHNTVRVIHEDRRGAFWIGTGGGGLNKFDPQTETFTPYRHDEAQPQSLSHDYISSIAPGMDGTLWIGTQAGGVNHFDPQSEQFVHYFHDAANPQSLSHDDIRALYVDRTGILWVGTFGNLNKTMPGFKGFRSYRANDGTANSLSARPVFSIYQDRAEIVWIGTKQGGLTRFDPGPETFSQYLTDSTSLISTIYAIVEDQRDRLWLGTRDPQLHQFDRETGRLISFELKDAASGYINRGSIQTLYPSSTEPDILWIGTAREGLYKYDMQTRQAQRFINNPDDPNSLSHNFVWLVYEDPTGTLWICTLGGGLNALDPKTGTFRRYRHNPDDPKSLSSDRLASLRDDGQGTLWIGTFDEGLNRFDQATGQVTRYKKSDGLPWSDVGGILIDEAGLLWLSTSRGLSRFDPKTEQFVNYDVTDGLQSNTFHYRAEYKGSQGEFYFGGDNGFNIFDPAHVRDNPHVPPIVLTDFQLFNESETLDQSITTTKEIRLRYDQNFIAFEFAALDFTEPSMNRYRYKLDGVDAGWVDAGTRNYAGYPNLSHGRYTFHVQGTNNDGLWNHQGASVRIFIAPPWWRRWWFYSLVTLAVLGLVTAAYRYRVARLLEMEHMRIRIASDLHDDLGGKLSGIALMTDMVQRRATFDETARRRLAQVSETARHMVDELRDIVWFITPEYDKLDDTLTKMQNITETLLGEINYTFHYPEDVKGEGLAMEFRRHFLLCYKEILHNVVRHAQAANVEIRLGWERGRLILTVADDGVGFDPEAASDGNGLKNMRQRATLMNGAVEIDSRPGAGTRIMLTAKTT